MSSKQHIQLVTRHSGNYRLLSTCARGLRRQQESIVAKAFERKAFALDYRPEHCWNEMGMN